MNLGPAREHARASLEDLRDGLQHLAARHAAEADVYHVGLGLAARCNEAARSFGDGKPGAPEPRPGHTPGEDEPPAGLALLEDLRKLAVEAHGAQIDVLIVQQGAMAARDREMVMAAKAAAAEIGRVDKWLQTRIKEAAPQALAALP
jgi:hypothetical protein